MSDLILAAMFASPIKILFMAGVFILWALCIQWIDRDAEKVRTVREKWNLLGLSTGILGIIAWLMVPWQGWALYLAGWGLYMLIAGGGILFYVAHRNHRVSKEFRVLTAQHFSRLMTSKSKTELDRSKHEYRVRLFNHDKKPVALPDDFEGAEQFTASQDLLYDAMWRRANEVDLSTSGEDTKLTYRIDGVLAERRDFLTADQSRKAITFLKAAAGLEAEERRRPQRGNIRAALLGGEEPSMIEVHTSGTTAGERLLLRLSNKEQIRPLAELGMHPQRVETVEKLIAQPKGLIIASGPPQSGVTTTLYAMIRRHDAYIQNIHTLEKRILFELDNITQNVFDPTNKEAPYPRRLQSILRREPNVMLIGELDEKEAARQAVKGSRDGRKIYAAMTAIDSFEALELLIDMVENRKALAAELLAITNQRLIRQLCPSCREAYRPDPELLRKANLPVDRIDYFYRPPTQKVYDKQGREIVCPTCQGSGYTGRLGVFEVLVVDDTLRQLIGSTATITQIKAEARKNKMYYIQEEGLIKTMEGTTSMSEVLRGLKKESVRV
ncbi:MAG: hypothetical protein HJJLKODD_02336 [Phycisphaerae bacterium]|nr:hypothetical protein [Phycisphaerae bacterium]